MSNLDRKVDINTILNFLNLVVFSLTLIWFADADPGHPYVDKSVVFAAALVHIQLILFLRYERKKKNPFLLILVIVTLFFYLSRIFTLLADEFMVSLTFNREGGENIGTKEIATFLIYLHFSLWAIFFGVKVGDKQRLYTNNTPPPTPIKRETYLKLLFLGLLSVLYFPIAAFFIDTNAAAGLLLGLFSGFFNYEVFVMLITIMAFYYKDKVPKRYSRCAFAFVGLLFFMKILNGGSGPMLRIGFPFFFTLLMITKRIRIKLSLLLVTVVLVIATSFFGTFLKFSNQKINLQLVQGFKELDKDQYKILFSQIAARSAFLDFSVELINNKEYARIINLPRYGKSLVDAYTPGFDLFDEPLTGHALRAVYLPSFPMHPTRKDVAENYNSDQINIFSEYYVLFGPILSMLFFFLSAILFKRGYNYCVFIVKNKIIGLLLGAIILNLFWVWLRSFGIDFILADMTNLVYPIILIYYGSRIHFGKTTLPVSLSGKILVSNVY
jgi:hypothetical protein